MQATLPEPRLELHLPTEADIEVTVVLPCLNEARTVGVCVAKAITCLERLGVPGEIIVADNGSSDGSQEIARAQGARVIHASRRGYGAALQAGIAVAKGRFVIMGDADDSYDFTNLGPFIDKLRQGDELVMGNRFRGGIKPGAMPWLHRYVGNPILTGILNLFFHTPIGDAHCGLRAFRKDAYQQLDLTTPGMEFASEMVVKACLHKQKISEVPTTLSPDGRDRPPHLRSFRDGWRHLRFLLLMCPFWLYFLPAAVLMGGGIFLMANARAVGNASAMLVGAVGVVVGYQALWLGVCAKTQGWISGLFPAEGWTARILKRLNLERGLAMAGGMTAFGMGLLLMNQGVWGFTFLVLAMQTIGGSFFLAMLRMTEARHRL